MESKAASCSADAELGGVRGEYPQYLPVLPYSEQRVSADLSLPMSLIGILSGASSHTYDVSYSKELQVTLEVFKMRLDREGAR